MSVEKISLVDPYPRKLVKVLDAEMTYVKAILLSFCTGPRRPPISGATSFLT